MLSVDNMNAQSSTVIRVGLGSAALRQAAEPAAQTAPRPRWVGARLKWQNFWLKMPFVSKERVQAFQKAHEDYAARYPAAEPHAQARFWQEAGRTALRRAIRSPSSSARPELEAVRKTFVRKADLINYQSNEAHVKTQMQNALDHRNNSMRPEAIDIYLGVASATRSLSTLEQAIQDIVASVGEEMGLYRQSLRVCQPLVVSTAARLEELAKELSRPKRPSMVSDLAPEQLETRLADIADGLYDKADAMRQRLLSDK